MITSAALAHMADATQHMGWGVMETRPGNQNRNVSDSNLPALPIIRWNLQKRKNGQSRMADTQALDKVWSHLKKHVPKSLGSRDKCDRRLNSWMEQYVYSYMWRFNHRNWWKDLGQLCNDR